MAGTCCVCCLSEDEQTQTPFSWLEWVCNPDWRGSDDSPSKLFLYGLCCPSVFFVTFCMSLASSNMEALYMFNRFKGLTPVFWFNYPSVCGPVYDMRRWLFCKHYVCLCCRDAGPNSVYNGCTGLHGASLFGHVQTIKYLLNYGEDIN